MATYIQIEHFIQGLWNEIIQYQFNIRKIGNASNLSWEKIIERFFKSREIGDSGDSSTLFKDLKTVDEKLCITRFHFFQGHHLSHNFSHHIWCQVVFATKVTEFISSITIL